MKGVAVKLPRRSGGALGRLGSRVDYRLRTLGVAAFVALLALVVLTSYLHSYERGVREGVAKTDVLVAARDIPAGTPAASLAHGLLQLRHVPRDAVVPGAIASAHELAGLVSQQPILKGEQVTVRRFQTLAAAGLRGELSGTMRAERVVGDPAQLLAGLVHDGDRVDVVVASGSAATGVNGRSRIVLRNVLVVQAPDANVKSTTTGSTSAVLALSDSQAQTMFLVAKTAQWSLLLRPALRSSDGPDVPLSLDQVLGGAG